MPMLLLLISMALGVDIDVDVFIILWPIGSVAWLIAGYFLHKKADQSDIDASIARTQDPSYVELLVKAGYKIYNV